MNTQLETWISGDDGEDIRVTAEYEPADTVDRDECGRPTTPPYGPYIRDVQFWLDGVEFEPCEEVRGEGLLALEAEVDGEPVAFE